MINGFAFYSYLPIVWLHRVVFFVLVVAVVFFGLFNRHDYKYLIINFYFKKLRFHFHFCFLCIRTLTHRPTHAWLKWHFRFKVNDWPNRKRWKVVLLLLFVGHFLNQHANTVRACQRIFDSLFFPGLEWMWYMYHCCCCCYSFIDQWAIPLMKISTWKSERKWMIFSGESRRTFQFWPFFDDWNTKLLWHICHDSSLVANSKNSLKKLRTKLIALFSSK